jgi:subtilisin
MRRRLWLFCVLILIAFTVSAHAEPPLVDHALMQRARALGTVRVIVDLGGVHVVPEGNLHSDVAVSAQRQSIARVQDTVEHALRGTSHRIVRRFKTGPLLAIEASLDALRVLETMRGVVLRVHEDAIAAPNLAESGPLIGAPVAWSAGIDGTGQVIAILDTGVDKTHPFLANKVVAEACFSTTLEGRSVTTCPNGREEQLGPGAGIPCPIADCSHGTHVAGIAAGAGESFSGIARNASVMSIQVFSRFVTPADCENAPPCARAFVSDTLAALEHVYSLRGVHHLAAVNLSLGSGRFSTSCDGDPRKPIIDTLRSAGIATTVSAGNNVFLDALNAPACVSTAISVSATTKTDTVSPFSNVASFLSLFAPGLSITSSIPGGGFASGSGTSLAAPHAAGAFALLRQAVPGTTVGEALHALQVTGRSITDVSGITRPRIDLGEALSYLGIGPLAPFAVLDANGASFAGGETLTLHLSAGNPSGAAPLDLYVGGLFPDGNTIVFLTASNVLGGLGQLSQPATVGRFTTAGGGFFVTRDPILSFIFPATGLQAGVYQIFTALFRGGSLADNTWDDGDLVWLSVLDVGYSP